MTTSMKMTTTTKKKKKKKRNNGITLFVGQEVHNSSRKKGMVISKSSSSDRFTKNVAMKSGGATFVVDLSRGTSRIMQLCCVGPNSSIFIGNFKKAALKYF